jgi:hypothetical protein
LYVVPGVDVLVGVGEAFDVWEAVMVVDSEYVTDADVTDGPAELGDVEATEVMAWAEEEVEDDAEGVLARTDDWLGPRTTTRSIDLSLDAAPRIQDMKLEDNEGLPIAVSICCMPATSALTSTFAFCLFTIASRRWYCSWRCMCAARTVDCRRERVRHNCNTRLVNGAAMTALSDRFEDKQWSVLATNEVLEKRMRVLWESV